jgi:HEAT repeat protein
MAKQWDQLRSALYSSNTDQRVQAVRQLGEQRVWGALKEVMGLLEQDEIGFSVAQAMTAYGPELCERIEYALMVHEKQEVRYRVAWILGHFGDSRAIKPLREAIREPFFPAPFLPMLKRLGVADLDRQMVSELSRHRASTKRPDERYRAVAFLHALIEMRSPAALELAPHFLQEGHDPLVRQYAQQYLSALAPDQYGKAG